MRLYVGLCAVWFCAVALGFGAAHFYYKTEVRDAKLAWTKCMVDAGKVK